MDKSKQKKQPRGRKRRLQLDDEEESHSGLNSASREQSTVASNKTPSKSRNSSTSRKNPASVTATKSSRLSKGLKNKATSLSSAESSAGFPKSVDPDAPTPKAPEADETTESQAGINSDLQRAGASSPEPNCAICLGQMENKSFTDSCFHQFCFVCLLEWSKVKAECPLCKQSFKSIVHNVRSYKDYDQYELPRPENRVPMYDFSAAAGRGIRFRYRTTVTDHRYAHIAEQINQEIESRLLQRPSRSLPIPNYRRLHQPANSEFRRSVYLQRLKLSSQHSETRRRVRETSPTFFRDNPAQTHRLVPWVNRELNALLQGHGEQVAFVLDLIMGLIKRFTIDSEEFYQHVFPYIGRHTRQFMQEFMMFARSPYHMAAYDRHISYEPSNEPSLDSDSDSDHRPADNGNDSDVIVVSPGNSPPPPRGGQVSEDTGLRRNWSADPSFFPGFNPLSRSFGNDDLPSMNPYTGLGTEYAPPSASGWDSPTPGPSQLSMPGFLTNLGLTPPPAGSMYTRICCGPNASWTEHYSPTSVRVTDYVFEREQTGNNVTLPSTSQNDPIRFNDTDSDSNSSDIEIVDVEKPWNERSPIHLSSGGDTDYDVMITGMTHINDPVKTEKKKKKKHKRHMDDSHSQKKTEGDRSADSGREMHAKKRRHRSRSRSLPRSYRNPSRSRTRSLSPLRLTIFRSPEYQHKKFGYRTNSERMDEWSQGKSSSSSRRRSCRSVSSSGTDTESHLSITSHRQSSKSKHSCVEIVEYRKKSSKTKKHKKHKSKDRMSGFESGEKKHKKRKKHSRSVVDESEIMGTSKSHSKHKSKKKKHHKEKKKSHKKNKEQEQENESSVGQAEEKKKDGGYTSDSESDSDSNTDFIPNDEASQGGEIHQDKSNSTSRSQNFVPTGLEFEEVDAAQAAILDEELDSINRTLSSNDYINSLLTGNTFGQNKETNRVENNDPNKIVNPNDVFSQKTFKKHPFGHKKSGKTSQSVARSSTLSTSATVTTTPATFRENVITSIENSIQSNDISSCSDFDFERQLPSFLTFSNRNFTSAFSSTRRSPNLLGNMFNNRSWRNEPLSKKSCTATAPSYESPTSTATYFEKDEGSLRNVSDMVNVDSLSNDSYIDVTDMNVPTEPSLIPSYQTSRDSLKLPSNSANNYIDVVGDSDNETTNEMDTGEISNMTKSEDIDKQQVEDVSEVDVENDDSDIECSLVEGHKTFEIGEDSDSDINVENIDEVSRISGDDIDILRHSDDEIIIDDGDAVISGKEKRMTNEPLIVHSDSETDLDYNCEDDNDVNDKESTYQRTEGDSQHTEIYEEDKNTETDVHGEKNSQSSEHESSIVTGIDNIGNTECEIPLKLNNETVNDLSRIINKDENSQNAIETEQSEKCDDEADVTDGASELRLGDSKKSINPEATDVRHSTGTRESSSENSTSDNDFSMNDKVESEDGECTEEEVNQSLETFRKDGSDELEQLEVESDAFTDINESVDEHSDKSIVQKDETASGQMNCNTSDLRPGPSNLDVSSLQSSCISDQLNTNSTSQSSSSSVSTRAGSGFRWTANPLYQARRLSLSELPPESQYIVHLPNQRAPSYSPTWPSSAIPSPLSSPDTEETFSSYEVWDGPYSPNSHDGDFQVED